MLAVISLGAGVQSSVMALMAAHGQITPMPDAAIFADTHWEPKGVYDWLDWLETQLPFPVYRVSAGNLEEALLSGKRAATAPFYTETGMLMRQCTMDYKVTPIRKKLRELIGLKPRQRAPKEPVIEQWMGISQDEIQRMKHNPDKWVENRFPLIEKRMTRLHCLEWMADNGYNELPQKSACIGCPYHDDASWRKMKSEDPESWEAAVLFDSLIRDKLPKVKQSVYLHRSRLPLGVAPLDDPAKDQEGFSFMDECEGMCGV
jgi:hypothetical protein